MAGLYGKLLASATFLLTLSALIYFSTRSAPTSLNKPPHIVFIVADDLGWSDVGWVDPNIHTPHLQRLAQNGIILNNSYVQKLCSPSRAALLSGRFPFRLGLQHGVIRPRQKSYLPLNVTTLPQVLKKLGYATHAVGKWHLGSCNWQYTPTYRGFDSFFGYYNSDEDYYSHVIDNALDFRFNEEVNLKDFGEYSTFLFSRRAQDILESHPLSQPLFLYLGFQAIHYPLQVPKVYEDAYCSHVKNATRRTFCGMLAAMDEAIGNITQALERLGYMDNMLLVFTTDNGGDPAYGGSNWPLRGAKNTLWEGGNRGRGFLFSKNLFKKTGTAYNGLMHLVDWFPTLVTLAEGEAPEGIDGVSQWKSIVNGEASQRTEFVYNIDEIDQNAAIRMGDWKLIQGNPGNAGGWYPIPDNGSETFEANSTQWTPSTSRLYNIKEDPYEKTDVAATYPDVLARMISRLEEWRTKLVPANYPPNDPLADPIYYGGVWSPGWC